MGGTDVGGWAPPFIWSQVDTTDYVEEDMAERYPASSKVSTANVDSMPILLGLQFELY